MINKKKIFNGRYIPSNLNKYLGFQYSHYYYKNNNFLNNNYWVKTEPSHSLNTFDCFKKTFDAKDNFNNQNIEKKGFRSLDYSNYLLDNLRNNICNNNFIN